jgi:hypothetical protein
LSTLKERKVNLLKFKGFKNETRIEDLLNFIKSKDEIFQDVDFKMVEEYQIKKKEKYQDILYH